MPLTSILKTSNDVDALLLRALRDAEQDGNQFITRELVENLAIGELTQTPTRAVDSLIGAMLFGVDQEIGATAQMRQDAQRRIIPKIQAEHCDNE